MKNAITRTPSAFEAILTETNTVQFDQLSESSLGSLLASLCASKPAGKFIELGTGTGLATSWILHGMDNSSTLTTIDSDEQLVNIARQYLGDDSRVQLLLGDGEELINKTKPGSVDFIFADCWPGKYSHLVKTLNLLNKGGIYLIDDMLARDSWPEGHADKANQLLDYLQDRDDLIMTKIDWSSGIVICTKK